MTRQALKYLASINRQVLPESTDGSSAFAYIDISAVTDGTIELPSTLTVFKEAPSRARRLAPAGATIISTVRTYLRAVASVPPSEETLVFSTGFAVLEAKPTMHPRFLYYACRAEDFINEVVARSTGVSYPAIAPSDLAAIPLPVPPLDEQRRIAEFLDDQVAVLDRAKTLRQQQGALLNEQLEAAIAAEIEPYLAGSQKLGYVLSVLRDGSHTPPPRVDDGVPLLTAKNVKGHKFQFTSSDTLVSAADADMLDRSIKAQPRDLLLSIKGSVGNVALVPDQPPRFTFERNLALLRCRTDVLDPPWLYYAMRSRYLQDQITLGTTYSAQPGIYLGALAVLRIPVPPLSIQQEAASRLDAATSLHDGASRLLLTSRDLFQERKQALITAAVSGELDVTTARSVA